jgi:hypothetical protein
MRAARAELREPMRQNSKRRAGKKSGSSGSSAILPELKKRWRAPVVVRQPAGRHSLSAFRPDHESALQQVGYHRDALGARHYLVGYTLVRRVHDFLHHLPRTIQPLRYIRLRLRCFRWQRHGEKHHWDDHRPNNLLHASLSWRHKSFHSLHTFTPPPSGVATFAVSSLARGP